MEYYYHGTESLDQMIEIIESGGIKSKNKRNANYDTLYNGDDYISLGKWDNSKKVDFTNMYDSCFYGWIFWKPTFIINPDIDALHALPRIGEFDPNVDRVSPFQDEYHVKDEIELDKIVGIALPFSVTPKEMEEYKKMLKIMQYAKVYKWNIYESDQFLIDRVNNRKVFDDMEFHKVV